MVNLLVAFVKLNYSMEYIFGAIILIFLLIVRHILASQSKKSTQTIKNIKKKVEDKSE